MIESTFVTDVLAKKSLIPLLLNSNYQTHKQTLKDEEVEITIHEKGIIEFLPAKYDAKDDVLIISAGIHGNETAPIEITSDIVVDLLQNTQKCKRPTLFIFGNLDSMKEGKRFVDFNLNRLFNEEHKKHRDCAEAIRAKDLENYVCEFRTKFKESQLLHLDLHTAIRGSYHKRFAISPVSNKNEEDYELLLKAMDIEAYIEAKTPSNTFSDFSSRFSNSTSFTVELGKVKPFGENELSDFSGAIKSLRQLIAKEEIETPKNIIIKYRTFSEITKKTEDFHFVIDENDKNFSLISKGTSIFKEEAQDISYDKDLYLVFANSKVVVGQRAGILLEKV